MHFWNKWKQNHWKYGNKNVSFCNEIKGKKQKRNAFFPVQQGHEIKKSGATHFQGLIFQKGYETQTSSLKFEISRKMTDVKRGP